MGIQDLYGSLTIDGADALNDFGFVVLKKSMSDWLLFPDMKEPFLHDWKDQHGLEVDLSHRYFKEKNVTLKIAFIADSELDFWNRYKACEEALSAPGLRNIYYRELDKEFGVYYMKSSSPEAWTRLKNVNKIAIGMTLHFVMPDPSSMIERLVAPDSITLVVNDITGSGSFAYSVSPATASQNVRTTVTPGTGNAYVAGNMIYATVAGTVKLRVASTLDGSVYAEKTINVYPANIIRFADGEMLTDGNDYITEY
jgi:hypothetical protein